VRCGLARFGKARPGKAWRGKVQYGVARRGRVSPLLIFSFFTISLLLLGKEKEGGERFLNLYI